MENQPAPSPAPKSRQKNQSYLFTDDERERIENAQAVMSKELDMDISFRMAAQRIVRRGLEAK